MKKLIALFLVIVSMFVIAQPVVAAVVDPVEPRYVNVSRATTYLSINTSGVADVELYCCGKSCLENTSVTAYLQQKVDGSWRSIKTWSYSTTDEVFTKTYSYQLSNHGEYRVLAYFRCTGTTSETISATATKTY